MKQQRRVVITGIGIVSPLGLTMDELMNHLIEDRSSVRVMHEWQSLQTGLSTKVASPVDGFDEQSIPRKFRRSMSRISMLAFRASEKAILDANLTSEMLEGGRMGVSYGSCMGGLSEIESYYLEAIRENSLVKAANSSTFLKIMPHTCAANIATALKISGRVIASCTACAASTQAIGYGYEAIKYGIMDRMLCGGAEELNPVVPAIFDALGATSAKYNELPTQTPRPFDQSRDGIVVGEGAGSFILEDYESAVQRNAKIYGEIKGFYTNNDGSHMTSPAVDGLYQSMLGALNDAQLQITDIDYINAHATATDNGDLAEAEAIHRLFGANAVPVSSMKGHFGHLMGAAGIIETTAALAMMQKNILIPTKNLLEIDARIGDVNLIKEKQSKKIRHFLKNSFAFGGVNATIIIGC